MIEVSNLEKWQHESDIELQNTLYRPPQPTGMVIHQFGGWRWATTDAVGNVRELRTNAEGQGLWELTATGWQQIQGTGQFSLPADKRVALGRLRRRYSRLS